MRWPGTTPGWTCRSFQFLKASLPEVDENFITRASALPMELTRDPCSKEIRGNLERELAQATTSMMKMRLIDELVKSMPDLEVPALSIVRA